MASRWRRGFVDQVGASTAAPEGLHVLCATRAAEPGIRRVDLAQGVKREADIKEIRYPNMSLIRETINGCHAATYRVSSLGDSGPASGAAGTVPPLQALATSHPRVRRALVGRRWHCR